MKGKLILLFGFGLAAVAGWAGFNAFQKAMTPEVPQNPVTTVRRGDVNFTVTATGDLQGATAVMLTTPPTGGREMIVTYLRKQGELVNEGDVVAQFDTTEQEYALREAEADLGEVEQQLASADADAKAKEEEARYSILRAEAQVKIAELEVKKNPLVASYTARQNDIALAAAQDQLRKLKQDVANRLATSAASLAIQQAALTKAKVKAATAKRNIDAMTVKSKSKGYVSIQPNMASQNIIGTGIQVPLLQVGDTTRAGMAIAQVPDMEKWEASARVTDLDRGHLAEGNAAEIKVIALPGRVFHGKVKSLNGSECRISLSDPAPEMRPGMSMEMTVTTGVQKGVLWIPSQALFENGGKTFVYLQQPGGGFQAKDVKMIRRSESKVVIEGLTEGQHVALVNPTQMDEKKGASSVMQAAPKK